MLVKCNFLWVKRFLPFKFFDKVQILINTTSLKCLHKIEGVNILECNKESTLKGSMTKG